MAILEGGVRFPVDPLVLSTLMFYGLCPDQLPPNFYRVISCVNRLNQIYELQLNYHDINFMYSLCGNIRSDYYLKVRDVQVWLNIMPSRFYQKFGKRICSGERQLACRWAPLPNFVAWHWLVPSTFNCFKSDVFPALISLTHILIGFHVVLVQKVKHLNWTLESCTWKISILWFGWRYLCILTDNSRHPISYSVANLYTLPGNLSARLC